MEEVTREKFDKCRGKFIITTSENCGGYNRLIIVHYKNGCIKYEYDTEKDKVVGNYTYLLKEKE